MTTCGSRRVKGKKEMIRRDVRGAPQERRPRVPAQASGKMVVERACEEEVRRRWLGSDATPTRGRMRARWRGLIRKTELVHHYATYESDPRLNQKNLGKHGSTAPLSGHNSENSRCPRVNRSLTDVSHPYGASAAMNTAPVRRPTSDSHLGAKSSRSNIACSNQQQPSGRILLRRHVQDTRLAAYRAREQMACDQGDESGDSTHLSYTLRLCHGCRAAANRRSQRLF